VHVDPCFCRQNGGGAGKIYETCAEGDGDSMFLEGEVKSKDILLGFWKRFMPTAG
jgi:hypothetical protein